MKKKEVQRLGEVPQDILDLLLKICGQMAPRHLFPGRDIDDMIQQGMLICLESLHKWDGVRPLENFMRVHLSRRYRNYKRDNYCRYERTTNPDRAARLAKDNKNRQNIMSPMDLGDVANMISSPSRVHEDVAYDELISFLKKELPVNLRGDFLRMLDETHIPPARRDKVREAVSIILEKYHGGEE